jgi:hypothetical protein
MVNKQEENMFTTLYNVMLYNNTTDEIDINFIFKTKEEADSLFSHIDAKITKAYGPRYNSYYNLFIDKLHVADEVEYTKHLVDDALRFEVEDEDE